MSENFGETYRNRREDDNEVGEEYDSEDDGGELRLDEANVDFGIRLLDRDRRHKKSKFTNTIRSRVSLARRLFYRGTESRISSCSTNTVHELSNTSTSGNVDGGDRKEEHRSIL